jgi:Tol biopolymer transport system component
VKDPVKTRIPLIIAGALALAACREEIKVAKNPPEARKDYARVPVAGPVTLDPRANDFDPENEALTVVSVGVPTAGTAVLNLDQTVTWTPPAGFTGGASFSYVVQDASGNAVEGTAYVTVGQSTRVMFLSDIDDFENPQLYLSDSAHPGVNIAVNGRFPVSFGPQISSSLVLAYSVSPDRTHVAYVGNPDADKSGVFDLFVSDIENPGAAQQLTDLPGGRTISGNPLLAPRLTSDNRYVVYGGVQDNEDKNEVYLIDRQNPATHQRVHPALDEDEFIDAFALAPNGQHILYAQAGPGIGVDPDPDDTDVPVDASFTSIYVTEIGDLSNRTRLNGTQTAGVAQSLDGLRLSPTGTLAAYIARENGSTTHDLYVVDYAAGTPPVKVSGVPRTFGVTSFIWTPDGTRLIYLADEIETFSELFMVPVANPNNRVRVSAPLTEQRVMSTYMVSDDSSYLVYERADLDPNGTVFELFMVELANPGVVSRVNAPLEEGQSILGFRLAPGAQRSVLYGLDLVEESRSDRNVHELRLVDLANPGTATAVGTGFTASSRLAGIFNFDLSGQKVIYRADPDTKFAFSLQLVDLGAPSQVMRLSGERVPGAEVRSLENLP